MRDTDYIHMSEVISMIIIDNSAKFFEALIVNSYEDQKNQTVVKLNDVFNNMNIFKEKLYKQIMEELS